MQEPTGFKLTKADAIAYSKWVAKAVHDRGMIVGCASAARCCSMQASLSPTSSWPASQPPRIFSDTSGWLIQSRTHMAC